MAVSGETPATEQAVIPQVLAQEDGPGFWDKLDILLKPLGALTTAAVVAFIGYKGSDILQSQQQSSAKVQLYAEIMSSREAAETGLRREMFNSIIETFLNKTDPDYSAARQLERELLAVQLLTYNFHDAMDVGPLFKYLEKRAQDIFEGTQLADVLKQLKRTARDVIAKQIAALESEGELKAETFYLSNRQRGVPRINLVLPDPAHPVPLEDTWSFISEDSDELQSALQQYVYLPQKHFHVEMLGWDKQTQEVRIRLKVTDVATEDVEFDEVFWVGSFDFPLIDNTRLNGGGRCAVVLQKFTAFPDDDPDIGDNGEKIHGDVALNLIYFHGSRASLKTKPYYDEVIREAIGQ